jgi:hypothetical protein
MEKVKLNPEAVKEIFKVAQSQSDYIIGIYKMVLPSWDNIKTIDGWPSVNENTWKDISRMAREFDHAHHDDCIAGGLWMNKGFSTARGKDLPDWEVSMEGVTLTMA